MTNQSKSPTSVIVLAVIGLISVIVAWLHIGFPAPETSVSAHHIQHLFFLIGGSLWGIALALWMVAKRGPRARNGVWLIPALLAPMVAMFLMWPSTYPYIEAREWLHILEHGVFIVLGVLTTYAAYQYAPIVSWLVGASLAVMAWLAAFFFGVPSPENPVVQAILEAPATVVTSSATTDTSNGSVDEGGGEGQLVFERVCAACHQATGMGIPGAFPPLADHFGDIIATEDGRDFAVNVVLYGLQGAISINGQNYNSMMPPQPMLTDAEVADVLNYVSTAWGAEAPSGFEAYTAEDVESLRDQGLTPVQVHEQRGTLGL